jgi:hypothetical protein
MEATVPGVNVEAWDGLLQDALEGVADQLQTSHGY